MVVVVVVVLHPQRRARVKEGGGSRKIRKSAAAGVGWDLWVGWWMQPGIDFADLHIRYSMVAVALPCTQAPRHYCTK